MYRSNVKQWLQDNWGMLALSLLVSAVLIATAPAASSGAQSAEQAPAVPTAVSADLVTTAPVMGPLLLRSTSSDPIEFVTNQGPNSVTMKIVPYVAEDGTGVMVFRNGNAANRIYMTAGIPLSYGQDTAANGGCGIMTFGSTTTSGGGAFWAPPTPIINNGIQRVLARTDYVVAVGQFYWGSYSVAWQSPDYPHLGKLLVC